VGVVHEVLPGKMCEGCSHGDQGRFSQNEKEQDRLAVFHVGISGQDYQSQGELAQNPQVLSKKIRERLHPLPPAIP